MKKVKILLVFGTRPEAIKMAPLVKAFIERATEFDTQICITAQHRKMLDQVLDFFELKPDFDLNLMRAGQTLHQITSDVVLGLKPILEENKPDYVLVHGDTSTTMAASLASYYAQIPVCHIEAGLRTHNIYSPFPEEMNRKITGAIAKFHFAPTIQAKENLLKEGIDEKNILITGNTVIDALLWGLEIIKAKPSAQLIALQQQLEDCKDFVLVTGHRRENHGSGFDRICEAIFTLADKHNRKVVFPVHLNPNVQGPVYEKLSGHKNILLIEPQPYECFIWLMNQAKVVLTDSGGIQEEAPSLGKPVLVMRDTTERPEAITAGTAKLVGTNAALIIEEVEKLFTDKSYYQKVSEVNNPYGDGNACKKITDFLLTGK